MRLLEAPFLIVATVLHLSIPVAATWMPTWTSAIVEPAFLKNAEIEIEIDDVDTPSALQPALQPAGDPALPSHGEYDPVRSDRAHSMPPTTTSATAPDRSDAPIDPDALAGNEYHLPPSRTDVDGGTYGLPGLGGPSVAGAYPDSLDRPAPGLPAPTASPRRKYDDKQAAQTVTDSLRNKDRKLGLDFPGGATLRRAAIAAVSSSDAPYRCGGSFSITINAKGRVASVALVSMSGASANVWAAIRQSVQARLGKRVFLLRDAFKKGAIVFVAVRSEVRSPSGGGSFDGVSGSFDISNAASKPRRVVSARVNATPIR